MRGSGKIEKEPLSEELVVCSLSGFAFYLDHEYGRKILVGVRAQNVKRNNYFDGPFDQLADNYIETDLLSEYVQQAYPYTWGRINRYGCFTDDTDSRIAITPYYTYYSLDELIDHVAACTAQPEDEFYSHLVYDYKTSVPPP